MWTTAILAGAVIGAGLALVLREFLPSTPKLQAAFDRLGAAAADETITADRPGRHAEFGAWIERRIGFAGFMRAPDKDLSVLGLSLHAHLARKGIYAAAVLAAFTIVGVGNLVQGQFSTSIVMVLPLAFGAWLLPDILVRSKATSAREDFRRAIGTYAELVAMEGYAGRHVSEALLTAAGVGRSWVFVRIRQELNRAQLSGQQSWDGLKRLADSITVPELAEIADIMRLAGEQEVTIYATLKARGKALRVAQLTDQKTGANRKSTNMTWPLLLMGGSFLAILITPAVSRLFSM
ncbi:Flp pilus assembly protein TadB [Arthrobacter sp. GAS37]|uniref:TadC protein n=1 Tax=Arthrobacter sp. GAS37 TaxID=3156261 RepID=UPI00383963F9